MRWRLLAVAVVVGALAPTAAVAAQPPSSQPPSSQPGPSQPPSSQPGQVDSEDTRVAADEGVLIVAELLALLDQLDALEVREERIAAGIAPVIEVVDWPDESRDDLVDELTRAELDAADVLVVLLDEDVGPSVEVQEVLGGLSDETWDAIEGEGSAAVDAGRYLAALDDLVNRNGRSPADGLPRRIDGDVLALAVEAEYESDGSVDSTEGAADPGDGGDESDSSRFVVVLVVVVGLAVGVGVVIGLRRRRPGSAGAFDDLLALSRSLSSARTAEEVERTAATELARLLGGLESTTAVVIRRDQSGGTVAAETRPGVLDPARLGDGLVARVVSTGQPFSGVVDHEPAIRSLPAAVVAIPVIGDGRVVGVGVALRRPDRPFTAEEVELATRVGPIVATALESARHAEAAEAASLTDPLTEVGNRRKLEADLPAVLRGAAGPTAVVMVDLDHFKAVNDGHGHPAGDAVLREVAAILRSLMRPTDAVYRYGGEEFTLVLPDTDEVGAAGVAERVRAAVRAEHLELGNGTRHRVTASLGVASTAGPDDLDALALVARADRALYDAKSSGRDRVAVATPG